MRLKYKPRAVIFDLDGVLLDTEPLYTEATAAVVSRFGQHFSWELKRQTMGTDPSRGAQLVIDALELPLSADEYLSERNTLLRESFRTAPAMPGVEAWVSELRALGLPVAVGTSSISDLCAIKWAPHPWLSQLDPKVCGDDPEVTARKPAPDIFLVAARRLGVAPTDCVVFEDSQAGVRAAKTAGMQVIALEDPTGDQSHLSEADLIVSGYAELEPSALLW
jgi:pseudouridine-5'-monophosphatase